MVNAGASDGSSSQPGLVFARKSTVIPKIDPNDVTKYCNENSFEKVAKSSRVSVGRIEPSDVTKYCSEESFKDVAKNSEVSKVKINPVDVTKYCNEDSFRDTSKDSRVSIGKIEAGDVTKYCNEDSFRKTSRTSSVEIEKMDVDDGKDISDDVFCGDEKLKYGAERKVKPESSSLANTFKSLELEGELYNSMNNVEKMGDNKDKDQETSKKEQNDSSKNKTKNYLQKVIDKLQKNDTLGIFATPIDVKLVPDYYECIKKPMDFSTMRKKLENGEYEIVDDVEADFNQMIDNCMIYNKKNTIFYKTAKKMRPLGDRIILEAKQKMQLKKSARKKEKINSTDLSTPSKEEMSGVDKLLKLMSKVVVKKGQEPMVVDDSKVVVKKGQEPMVVDDSKVVVKKDQESKVVDDSVHKVTEKGKIREEHNAVCMDSTKLNPSENTEAKENSHCGLLNKEVKVNVSKLDNSWSSQDGLPPGWQKRCKSSLETKKIEYYYKCPQGCTYKSTTQVEKPTPNQPKTNSDEDIVEIPRYMAAFDQFVTKQTKLINSLKQNSCVKCQESENNKPLLDKANEGRPKRLGSVDKESCVDKQERLMVEELDRFFKKNNLPLKARQPTKADGNGFFRAVADQILLHSISSVPSTHHSLRHAVCSHLKHLPEKFLEDFTNDVFKGDEKGLQKLSSRMRKAGEAVDHEGVMVKATALFLNRNIEVYEAGQDGDHGDGQFGHARDGDGQFGHTRDGDGHIISRVDGGEGAEMHPSLTVFYYKDFQHYQSISRTQ